MLGAIAYTGNKQKILPEIMNKFPTEYGRFVDLFCGGLSVALNVKGPVIANDIQKPIVDMFEAARNYEWSEIEQMAKDRNLSKGNRETYDELVKEYNSTKDPILLLLLHYYSFSNMIRFNKVGEFNAPFGKRQINKNSGRKFLHFKQNNSKIKFVSDSFRNIEIDDGDFVYADPPYLITVAEYNKFWSDVEDIALMEYLDTLDKRGIKFGMSNVFHHHGKTNDRLIKWAGKYTTHFIDKNYVFNAYHTKESGGTVEVYITNV
ncbi:DNA methyltransferase [Aeromonas phage GomatiRiver_11]|nr:DNA adenine methylase [Aeromonas phage AhFM11]WKW84264.1 DNA methyltransferase [Aeromonas phage GomatiRiver_11]